MQIYVNGQKEEVAPNQSLLQWLAASGLRAEGVAVGLNGRVLQPGEDVCFQEGDRIDLVRPMGGGSDEDPLILAGTPLASRLFVGTGKYGDLGVMQETLDAADPGLVTMAVRAIQPGESGPNLLDALDRSRYRLLPNTAGSTTAAQAIYLAQLARVATGTCWIKLEIVGDAQTLWPDTQATLEATRELVAQGFVVLAYTSTDLVAALRLQEAGAAAVMPLAAPIGTGQGLTDWVGIRRILSRLEVPVVVDAGLGLPSEAAAAMEMGAAAVLVNSALAYARRPAAMAKAFRLAVQAGRGAFLAGRMPVRNDAEPSSPMTGIPNPSEKRPS
ncbi:MAG: sulfur carrier protein ThiS [Firmicutes bacterium]|nr:sulfur carrier protein ThiS [Bacillota bacterium]